jgi:hypothetical protein
MRESRDIPATLPALVAQKLTAFDHLEPEFETSFHYIQAVQGEDRFASFAVAATVRYLHALWICECKDRLLSVPNAVQRYRGARGLALLRRWQETGETADVVGFLCEKLDSLDVVHMSQQLEAARQSNGGSLLARRLIRGRMLVVNRGMNLLHALDPLFALPDQMLRVEVEAACAHYGHTPGQVEEQLQQLETPLYAFVRHPALAQRNMVLMNRLGSVEIASVEGGDQPSSHIWRPAEPSTPQGPSAEQTIEGYVLLRAPWHNNPGGVRWVDRHEAMVASTTEQQQGSSHEE